jgi:hypothetical protein
MGKLVIHVDVDYQRDDRAVINLIHEYKVIDLETDADFVLEDALKSFIKRVMVIAKAPEA